MLNPKNSPLTPVQESNLQKLFEVLVELETLYGTDLIVTSGFRTRDDQMRINPRVKDSAHMMGEAVDLSDRDKSLWNFLMDNWDTLIRLGIYLEEKSYTVSWVHIQIRVPKSGSRVFIP